MGISFARLGGEMKSRESLLSISMGIRDRDYSATNRRVGSLGNSLMNNRRLWRWSVQLG